MTPLPLYCKSSENQPRWKPSTPLMCHFPAGPPSLTALCHGCTSHSGIRNGEGMKEGLCDNAILEVFELCYFIHILRTYGENCIPLILIIPLKLIAGSLRKKSVWEITEQESPDNAIIYRVITCCAKTLYSVLIWNRLGSFSSEAVGQVPDTTLHFRKHFSLKPILKLLKLLKVFRFIKRLFPPSKEGKHFLLCTSV